MAKRLRLPSSAAAALRPRQRKAVPVDILIKGDTIAAIGPRGLPAPAGAAAIDARHRLMHPGLINAHTMGRRNLSRGCTIAGRYRSCWLTASQWRRHRPHHSSDDTSRP